MYYKTFKSIFAIKHFTIVNVMLKKVEEVFLELGSNAAIRFLKIKELLRTYYRY